MLPTCETGRARPHEPHGVDQVTNAITGRLELEGAAIAESPCVCARTAEDSAVTTPGSGTLEVGGSQAAAAAEQMVSNLIKVRRAGRIGVAFAGGSFPSRPRWPSPAPRWCPNASGSGRFSAGARRTTSSGVDTTRTDAAHRATQARVLERVDGLPGPELAAPVGVTDRDRRRAQSDGAT